MSKYDYDLVIIGSGPGGYVAAIRAGQLGLRVAVVEKESPGGVCLNWGCIPSKALIHQAELVNEMKQVNKIGLNVDLTTLDYGKVHRKSRDAAGKLSKGVQFLLKKNNVTYVSGTGKFKSAHEIVVDDQTITADKVIIATGSRSRELPGFEFDGKKVVSSRHLLEQTTLPKSLLILGAGAIGMEFAYVMNAFGVEVTVVEMLDQVLPLEDAEAAEVVHKAFKKSGIKMHTGARAEKLSKTRGGVTLTINTGEKTEELKADQVLVAVGRSPNTEDLGLESVGVQTEKGFVVVGDYYQTAVPGVYAIGDIVNSPLLAHVAEEEGIIAVEHIAGQDPEPRVDPETIPSAVYCEPQIASFGMTEKQAKDAGRHYEVAAFPYRGAGKSVAVEKSEGLVKIVVDGSTREILGAHIVGTNATELIHEILLAKTAELLPEDIARMTHAHPTLSEAVMEAARASEGWAIHV